MHVCNDSRGELGLGIPPKTNWSSHFNLHGSAIRLLDKLQIERARATMGTAIHWNSHVLLELFRTLQGLKMFLRYLEQYLEKV